MRSISRDLCIGSIQNHTFRFFTHTYIDSLYDFYGVTTTIKVFYR